MKLHSLLILSLAFIAPILNAAEPTETITLSVDATNRNSQLITLAEGDRAELASTVPGNNAIMYVTVNAQGKSVDSEIFHAAYLAAGSIPIPQINNKIVLAGPATFQLVLSVVNVAHPAFATFDIHRAGAPSNAVPIPQEGGSNFNVILEQSSDLLNWTPANPGTYTGTEVKRFFRTRIVKLVP